MAKVKVELPNEIIQQLEKLNQDTPKMMKAMVEAGAETVL